MKRNIFFVNECLKKLQNSPNFNQIYAAEDCNSLEDAIPGHNPNVQLLITKGEESRMFEFSIIVLFEFFDLILPSSFSAIPTSLTILHVQ